MELTQIKYFKITAELEHITRAAEVLNIAQPALTKSIHKLERELGVPLFAAKGRNIVLTEYGKYLYDRISEPLKIFETVPVELASMLEQRQTAIRLNVLSASAFVTEAIIEYQKLNKGVKFSVIQNEQTDLWDVSISTYERKHEKHSENAVVVCERIMLAVPESSKWAKRTAIDLCELGTENFISLAGTRKFGKLCDNFCTKARFVPNITFESDNYTSVQNLIAAGSGVGFWPERTWGTLTKGVKLIPIISPGAKRELIIIKNSALKAQKNSGAVEFYNFLVKQFNNITT